jgi:enoyl-CoA hydratase/carnithine racemase
VATDPSADAEIPGVVVRRLGEHVTEIVLDRPAARNAISTDLALTLTSVLQTTALEQGTRAVVLSSSDDRAFCAGADLKERAGFSDAQLLAQRPVIRGLFTAVRELPMPAIAAVQGYALGGGCELALSCDVIVADDTAVFGLTEVTVGLVPGGGGTQLMTRRLGSGAASDLILSGRKVPADEAFRLGLADRLVPRGTARAAALELAAVVAENSPTAVRAAKQAVRVALGVELRLGLEIEDAAWQTAAVSADRREGIAAFAEKRPPRWSGS